MHKLFNGTKFRSVKNQGLLSYYNHYFDLLEKLASDSIELKSCVVIAGKKIDDMSPGMKAQALLSYSSTIKCQQEMGIHSFGST